jgi:hypothetical protein
MLKFLALQGAPYIYDISRLRVNGVLLLVGLQVDVRFNKDRNLTYSVSYVPRLEGNHKVSVKFAGREIPQSP